MKFTSPRLYIAVLTSFLTACGGGAGGDTSESPSAQSMAQSASKTNAQGRTKMGVAPSPITVAPTLPSDLVTGQSASISIDMADSGTPVNRALLGNNIEWTDNGDGLVSASGIQEASVVNAVKQTAPSVLRYPGGSLTDTYHWRDGVGPIASRGFDRDLSNNNQQVIFGTDEFLKLSSDLGATPFITVNVTTADAQEAADWVAYVNGTSQRVRYWEIGNEPYLIEDGRPDLAITPSTFAQRADLAIAAMKHVDPNIKVGLPLRSDTFNGIAATPYPGFNNTVLSSVTSRIDFVSVHNAYLPFVFTETPVSDQDLYTSAMAASKVMADDLNATALQVKSLRPEGALPIALTEYNAVFGLSTSALIQKSSSLAGALYVADVLSVLANRTDILVANFWSLSGNGNFGVVDWSGNPRPAYYVLQAFSRLLQGQVISSLNTSSTTANPKVGVVPAGNTPVIATVVTRLNKMLRVAVINKHSTSNVALSIEIANAAAAEGSTYSRLNGDDLFSGAPGYTAINVNTGALAGSGKTLLVDLPPHSFTLFEIPLI